MKKLSAKKITAIILALVSIISIALILTQTPILKSDDFADAEGKYLNYYITTYKITKSRDMLDHILDAYSMQGNNYDKLKPLFDDAFKLKSEYNQETIEANAFTVTESYYMNFLVSNERFEEADKFCDECLSNGTYQRMAHTFHSIGLFWQDEKAKDFGFSELKKIAKSDVLQKDLQSELDNSTDTSHTLGLFKAEIIPYYVNLLILRGEYDEAISEIEQMMQNKNYGDTMTFSVLSLLENSESEKSYELTVKTIELAEKSENVSDEQVTRMKETFLKSK